MTNKEFEDTVLNHSYIQFYHDSVISLHAEFIAQGRSFGESRELAIEQSKFLAEEMGYTKQDNLNTVSESLVDLERDTADKTDIHITKAEQETLHLAMNVLHQQGFVNTQGYTKMLEVLKVNTLGE